MTNVDEKHILNLKDLLANPGYYYTAGPSQSSGSLWVEITKNGKVQAVGYGGMSLPFEVYVTQKVGRPLQFTPPKIIGMELIND